MQTTVAHIVLERLNAAGENIVIPKEFDGNLVAEHLAHVFWKRTKVDD